MNPQGEARSKETNESTKSRPLLETGKCSKKYEKGKKKNLDLFA
jgi:hypothetical protein